MEFKDASRIEGVGQDMIVEVAPVVSCPRPADGNIATNAEENDGVYRPSRHLERIRDSFERQGKDSEAFVRSHVRRLEASRRAGHVERIDADHWKIPYDIVERGQGYDLSSGRLWAQNTDAVRAFCRELGVGVSETARFDEFCRYAERRSDEGRGPRADGRKSFAAGGSHRAVRPLRRQQFATLTWRVFRRCAVALISPRLKIGLGPVRPEHAGCR
jgi:Protein of unknown function (DUF3363)